jgi:hypothetical protein
VSVFAVGNASKRMAPFAVAIEIAGERHVAPIHRVGRRCEVRDGARGGTDGTPVQRGVDGGDDLADRHHRVAVDVAGVAGAQRFGAQRDADAPDQLVDRDGIAALAVAGALLTARGTDREHARHRDDQPEQTRP